MQKKFGSKNFSDTKYFSIHHFSDPELFWIQKNFVLNIFWTQIFLRPSVFHSKIFFGLKILFYLNLLNLNFLNFTYFLIQIFPDSKFFRTQNSVFAELFHYIELGQMLLVEICPQDSCYVLDN